MKKRDKKGQVTIFIIIAIVVVGLVILLYQFYPQIRSTFVTGIDNPHAFIQDCLEGELEEVVDKVASQGGSLDPELYYEYGTDKVRYLCYTNEYNEFCVSQDPMLLDTLKKEIGKGIDQKATECFNSLKEGYEQRGYNVKIQDTGTDVDFTMQNVLVFFGRKMTLEKEGVEIYENFITGLNNNIYELALIALDMLNSEATLGHADTTKYFGVLGLKVERFIQSDGTKIYILTDRDEGTKFQFASRSLVSPPGYIGE